ncbi:MAG: DNA topology modulation protein [Clostridia bacterium]|nr:DNA topology modulation protein [Clostridia bacterium]
MKIAIIGYSGSGKSTLAKLLSEYYQIPLLYLDTVHFTANWMEREKEERARLVREFLQNGSWVIDGNYTKLFYEERLEQADQIIFMNFSRWNCFFRACKRYRTYKNQTRESMADGCNEKMDFEFAKWILWDSRTKTRRAHFRQIIDSYPKKVTVIRNQRELDRFTAPFKKAIFT